ncbi:MAG TPA: hypothetical protein VK116_17170, partial [Planctomycetota bacterium]|nr:hypothetical protein [Planctomycetota bacterium]
STREPVGWIEVGQGRAVLFREAAIDAAASIFTLCFEPGKHANLAKAWLAPESTARERGATPGTLLGDRIRFRVGEPWRESDSLRLTLEFRSGERHDALLHPQRTSAGSAHRIVAAIPPPPELPRGVVAVMAIVAILLALPAILWTMLIR